jgi:N-acetylglucosamine kinase-like BadF-type ATPase
LAGFDFPEDRTPQQRIVDTLALGGPTHIGNDALMALVAGAPAGWGVVVAAGTSNNTLARDRFGNEAAAFGQGMRFGENGGATEIVAHAVKQVALARTARRPATALTDAFVARVGASDVDDLLTCLIRGRYELNSDDAPLVFATAEAGDVVAQEIIAWSGDELGDLACGAIRRLRMEDEAFDVVLAGSLFKGSPVIGARLLAAVQQIAPRASAVRLASPPVIGGVLLVMEEAGEDGTAAVGVIQFGP